MSTIEYNRGFLDGVKFVIRNLKEAALRVEKPTWGEVQNSKGHKLTVITKSGQPIFAARLRELAMELEAEIEGKVNADVK